MNMENARKEIEAKALNVTVAAEYLGWALQQLFPGIQQTDADYITAYQGLHRAYIHALKAPESPLAKPMQANAEDSFFNFSAAFNSIFPGLFQTPEMKAKEARLMSALENMQCLGEVMRPYFGESTRFSELPSKFRALTKDYETVKAHNVRQDDALTLMQNDARDQQQTICDLRAKVRDLEETRDSLVGRSAEKTKCLEQLEQAIYEAVGKTHTYATVPSNEERMEVMLGFVHELKKNSISTAWEQEALTRGNALFTIEQKVLEALGIPLPDRMGAMPVVGNTDDIRALFRNVDSLVMSAEVGTRLMRERDQAKEEEKTPGMLTSALERQKRDRQKDQPPEGRTDRENLPTLAPPLHP